MKQAIRPLLTVLFGCWAAVSFAQNTETETVLGNSTTAISFEEGDEGDSNPNTHWTFGTGLMYGQPLKDFEAGYRNGLAWHFELFTPALLPKESPLQLKLGAHVDGMFSGRETIDILLLDPAGVRADYGITNASVGGHLIGRLTTKPAKIMPYLDGIVGGRWLFSTEDIVMQETLPDYESVLTESISDAPTFIYGGSIGAMVKLGDFSYLDFRVTYSHGSRANYINLSTLEGDGGDAVYFQEVNTKTPLLFTNIGLVFQIGGRPYTAGESCSGGSSGDGSVDFGIFRSRRSRNRSNRNNNNNEYCPPSGGGRNNSGPTRKPSVNKNPPKKKPRID